MTHAAPSFFLDENVDRRVALLLRSEGVNVLRTQSAGRAGFGDRSQLAFATAEGRVFVTHDRDFLSLSTEIDDHAGIVFAPLSAFSPAQLAEALVALFHTHSAEQLKGRVVRFASGSE